MRTSPRKSKAQLDREIAQALAKKPMRKHRHHATRRDDTSDDWDVVMDAIMEENPKKAAKIAHNLRHEHGRVSIPDEISDALMKSGTEVWLDFERYSSELEAEKPAPKEHYYRDFTLRILQPDKKVVETYFRASRPMSLEAARERFIASGSVDPRLWHRKDHPGAWDLRDSTRSEIEGHRAKPLP